MCIKLCQQNSIKYVSNKIFANFWKSIHEYSKIKYLFFSESGRHCLLTHGFNLDSIIAIDYFFSWLSVMVVGESLPIFS